MIFDSGNVLTQDRALAVLTIEQNQSTREDTKHVLLILGYYLFVL